MYLLVKEVVMSNGKYDYITTPFPERLSFAGVSYIVVWGVLGLVLLALRMTLFWTSGESTSSLPYNVVLPLLPSVQALLIVWYSKKLEQYVPVFCELILDSETCVLAWCKKRIRGIFSDSGMVAWGMMLSAVVGLLLYFSESRLMPSGASSRFLYYALTLAASFMGGATLRCLFMTCRMVWELGRFGNLRLDLFPHPFVGIKAVGRLLAQISLVNGAVFTMVAASVCMVDRSACTVVSLSVFLIFSLTFFFLPQYTLHIMMQKAKYAQVQAWAEKVENAISRFEDDKSQKVGELQSLLEIHRSLASVGEWPFDMAHIKYLVGAVVFPLVGLLLTLWELGWGKREGPF